MRARFGELVQSLFFRLYLVTAAAVFALVLLLRDGTNYGCKISLALPGWLLLLAGIAGALILTWAFALIRRRSGLEKRLTAVRPGAIFLLLFLAQLYVCYNCYFETGWDVGMVMNYAKWLADGYLIEWSDVYLPRYLNNALITWLFSLFIRVSRYIGVLDVELSPYMAVITVQCALSSTAGWLVFRSAQRLWKSDSAAWGAALLYIALVGLSPWLMIPYSDSMGLFFPILAFWLYLSVKDSRHPALCWTALGAAAYMGYRVKPQCVICVIAILLVEGAAWLEEKKLLAGLRRRAACLAGFATAFCAGALLFYQVVLPSMNVTPNKDLAYSPAHFFMMGLNDTTDGVYSGDDDKLSVSISTAEERRQVNLEVAAQRIKDYGPLGLLRHTVRKTLVNFGDGSFAWGVEGDTFRAVFEPKNRFASPLLRNLYYPNAPWCRLFLHWAQTVWLLTLCAPLGLFCLKRRDLDKETLVLMLSVFGLTLFETLFEARARYLYTYAPYFVLLAVAGWRCGRQKLRLLREKRD